MGSKRVGSRKKSFRQSKKDNYPTPAWCVMEIIKRLRIPKNMVITDPMCGAGAILWIARMAPYAVSGSELREDPSVYPGAVKGLNCFDVTYGEKSDVFIITNPPYNGALEIAWHFLTNSPGVPLAMFLPADWHCAQNRLTLLKTHRPYHLFFTKRPQLFEEGKFTKEGSSGTINYQWIVWNWDMPRQVDYANDRYFLRVGDHRPALTEDWKK